MCSEFIPTRASVKKKIQETNVNTVIYKSHKPKEKRKEVVDIEEHKDVSITEQNELNMKQARFEIMKFGMSGFNMRKKEEAKVQLAIKLGAKPRKNKYKNYKAVLKERKKEKIREQKKQSLQKLGKPQLGKKIINRKDKEKRQKKDKSILGLYGTVKQTAMNT